MKKNENQSNLKSTKTMAFKVEESLQKALKIHCTLHGKSMADELNEMIRKYLKKHDVSVD